MRNLTELEAYRDKSHWVLALFGNAGDYENGVFRVPFPRTGVTLLAIATANGDGWDHVSVSLPGRCPNWLEMEHIKRMFFHDDETAMQLHVPPGDHISFAHNCLHLWRPVGMDIPRPPARLVGAPFMISAQQGGGA